MSIPRITWLDAARSIECLNCQVNSPDTTPPVMTRKLTKSAQVCTCGTEIKDNAKFCPECGARLEKLLGGPMLTVEYECSICHDHKGPFLVLDESQSVAPVRNPSAVVIPTEAEALEYAKPPAERPSPLALTKPPKEISQDELVAFAKEKFPKSLAVGDYDFPASVIPWSLPTGPTSEPVRGVKVRYGTSSTARAATGAQTATFKFDVEETMFCSDGEPNVEKLLNSIESQLRNLVKGMPTTIRKVVRVGGDNVGPNQICGECHQRRENCACSNRSNLTAKQLGTDLAAGAPESSGFQQHIRRNW